MIFNFCVGLALYQRTLVVFYSLLRYWEANNLPVFHLFKKAPAFFSEESGEIALSLLTRTRPSNVRADFEQTRKSWRHVKMRYEATHEGAEDTHTKPLIKKYRTIRTLFSFC